MTLMILNDKGQSNAQIARTLGVTEGAVRYHLRRAEPAPDGRRGKPRKADPLAQVIDHWVRGDQPARPTTAAAAAGQRPGPVRLPGRRARLRRLVPLGPAFRPRPLPRAPAAAVPPRRDAAGGPGPGRLGRVRRHRRRRGARRPSTPSCMVLSHSPQGGRRLVPADGPAGLAPRPQRGVPPPGRHPGGASASTTSRPGSPRGRAVGPGQPGLPGLRPRRRLPRRRLPAPLPGGQGQGREQGRRRPAAAAPAGAVSPAWPRCRADSDEQLARWDERRICPATGRTVQDELAGGAAAAAAAAACCRRSSTWR